MGKEAVQLMRSPIDTNCANADCKVRLPFGAWVYYVPDTGEALCIECSEKRGWLSKQRVKQLIVAMQLREDIKALRQEVKVELDGLALLRQRVDLHRLGERDVQLEEQIVKLMATVDDYLKHCGLGDEKEALKKVFDVVREAQELQKQIREHLHDRFFVLDRKEKKRQQTVEAQQ